MKYQLHTVRLVAGAFLALTCLLGAPWGINMSNAQTVVWDFETGDEGFTLRSAVPATPATDDPLTAGDESLTGVGGANGLPDAGLAWTIGGPADYNGLISAVPEGGNMISAVPTGGTETNDNVINFTGGTPPIGLNSRGQSNYLNTYNLNVWGDNLNSAANDQIAKSPNVVLPENAVLIMWTFAGGNDSIAPALDAPGAEYVDNSGGIAVRSASDDSLLASMRTLAQGTLTAFVLDLGAFAGQTVYVEVVDAFSGAWGWMSVDEIQITTSGGGFDSANYTFEAEDFNFEGGGYFDNPDVCNTIGGADNCYFDRVGTQDIDKHELDNEITAPDDLSVYRWGPDLNRVEFMDTKISSDPLTRTQYVAAGVSEYELRLGAGEWGNYTRTFPTGNYNLYARVPADAGSIPVRVDLVDNATVSNQNLTTVGYFVLEGSGAGGLYEMAPMTDYSGGTTAVLSFDGTPKTLRVTALANGYVANFYMLEATTNAPTDLPQVTITSPASGTVVTNALAVTATATSSGGAITNVQFYSRGVLIGEDNEGPEYSATFTPNEPEGNVDITAVATDDSGLSAAAQIIVEFNNPAFDRVSTMVGNGADAQLNENGEAPSESSGSTGPALNARTVNGNRNEIIAFRFDLSGYTLADLSDVTLSVVQHRDRDYEADGITVQLYGVHPDATPTEGALTVNDWDEASVEFATMPGLTFDADAFTQGINSNQVTLLDEIALTSNAKGMIETFSDEAIATFLRNYEGGNLVTFLVARNPGLTSGLQARIASKEATSLDGGTPTGDAGDFAPYLRFRPAALPEPIVVTDFSLSGDQLTLEWSGGTGPFSVRKKTLITDDWVDEQTGIAGNSTTVTISVDGGTSGYYQVVGQ